MRPRQRRSSPESRDMTSDARSWTSHGGTDLTSRRPTSSWIASERHGVAPAPGGLALVQDLLNTRASTQHSQDMLCDVTHAQLWVANAVKAWSAQRGEDHASPRLTDHDADRLRELRDMLETLISGVSVPTGHDYLGLAAIARDADGTIRWEPIGFGWRWLAFAVWIEVLLSQQGSTWQRLKQCPNPSCRATFYDRSWNNSAVWHNLPTCAPPLSGSPSTAGPRPG
jgi:predicted RNA-binding Zn ribbon-like protein